MTTATKTRRVNRTYRDPLSLGENSIRYFVDTKGRHVVVHELNCGEQDHPNVYRFDTVEEARAMWRDVMAVMVRRGYAERVR